MNIESSLLKAGLPSIVILFAVLEVLVTPFTSKVKYKNIRRHIVMFFIVLTTAYVAITYGELQNAPISYELSNLFGVGVTFKIDLFNYAFILLAGLLWLVVGFYNFEKINYLFYTITYISTLGTLMAGDLLSFFLFFEVMTFSSYALMVLNRGEEQLEAASAYIYMGIIGGLSILSAILMMYVYTGTFQWTNLAMEFNNMGVAKYFIAILFIAGFGIKSAMFPFHFWAPKTYEGAPFAVNALSSGMFMKVGAYGMLRVVSVLFSADKSIASVTEGIWRMSEQIGFVVIWLGILTMAVGVFMALQQGNMKRMLAYHSVSQMGYVIMGIGVAAYLGFQGPMGFIGAIYHMINHSLFKVLLFMVAGLVYMRTRETDMYKLGGLWKKMPITAILCLIAALGITGMPLFNGFASKSILHHAIIEAYEYGHPSFKYAELIFKLVSAGTVCSFIKFFSFIFLGEPKQNYDHIKGDHTRMVEAMSILAILIIAIGMRPDILMDKLFIPTALSMSFDPAFIEKYIVDMNFWNSKDLIGMVGVYFLGFGIFILGLKYHLFHLHLPRWLNAENVVYRPVTDFCEDFPKYCVQRYENKMISGDVFIYAILLTTVVGLLVISGFHA
ncbi:MAG: NADH dehydrogenase [Clostridiaceae bacterium]|nr:NADH dehydrogenase [Clostridiaceae bacterium]